MNERIRQLAEQAGSTHSSHAQGEEHMNDRINELWAKAVDIAVPETYTSLSWGQIQKIKLAFAELIVRECAKIADIADENKCEWIGGNILTHFGVEDRAVPILSADEQALFAGIASSKLFTIAGAKKHFGVEE